jgi:hypothetical protein
MRSIRQVKFNIIELNFKKVIEMQYFDNSPRATALPFEENEQSVLRNQDVKVSIKEGKINLNMKLAHSIKHDKHLGMLLAEPIKMLVREMNNFTVYFSPHWLIHKLRELLQTNCWPCGDDAPRKLFTIFLIGKKNSRGFQLVYSET